MNKLPERGKKALQGIMPDQIPDKQSEMTATRGKYRQYDESDVINKIRSYRTQRYPDQEIMKMMENMPRRTYYNFVKKMQKQDQAVMTQWLVQNIEQVSEDHVIFRENLCKMLRQLQVIIDDANTTVGEKLRAIKQHVELEEKLTRHDKDIVRQMSLARHLQENGLDERREQSRNAGLFQDIVETTSVDDTEIGN